MRNALHALTDELRRLKAAGVKTVSVSEESIAALRRVMTSRRGGKTGISKPDAVVRTVAIEERKPEIEEPALERMAGRVVATAPAAATPVAGLRAPVAGKSAGVIPTVSLAALPPAPLVSLPEGDKAKRWAA